ncbi:DUF262 domain-containing protein [Anabaena sp. FACHB-709]|uniref:DUF262 domain-containing protein n=2 Tax=Nostocaceae TaxID=1162 RepID=A0A1Z4KLE5_ANAVA|nr:MULTISPECIES: DUF262 domain-containing protein [Nostocaceae]BAY69802.1 hypothetical protein NIES23_26020 [Trichormus variabilis NIES-23]HBW33254.1 DUF262 domain-containing protein [Nostoc sp. UBA8866]MBD2172828.1 DUF262 domain-containing protein [Anabaena cylindrica FACHB-318]MBD2264547.1 DUF262 domain-containing protein [Anabaena sp. FACHB-709]MBD2273757.1 DUF262 domain-containing protein [Nostoc sp. PCC 7120 = FACHB-418]
MAAIESRDYTLEELFQDFYVVKEYQREYVWEEKQVRELLEDVYEPFLDNKSGSDWECFIGSIIVCKSQELYELIDGQQRMTTAYLIVCAVRDYLLELNPDEHNIGQLKGFITSYVLEENGSEKFKERIELQYDEESRYILERIARQQNFLDIPENSSVRRIKNAYQIALRFLKDEFGGNETTIQQVKLFYARFIKNVRVVRVETKSMSHALKVFATINNRGVGLDSMDLLKNLMFIQIAKNKIIKDKDFERLKNKWKEMLKILYESNENPIRFLRYFIVSKYDSERIREDKIYEWFEENRDKCEYQDKPFDFVDSLVKTAKAFANFKEGKDIFGKPNRYLLNISYLSTSQHFVLLLATQHFSKEMFTSLSKHLENFLFICIITQARSSKLEILFVKWASKLRQINNQQLLDQFIFEEIGVEKQKLAEKFLLAFRRLDEDSVRKKVLQYILAKLTQYIDELAYGEIEAHTNLKNYINKTVEIEHILPQNYELVKSSFDKQEQIYKYVKYLGNLTLIEKPINTSIKNKIFEVKKNAYQKSKFLITKSIVEPVNVGLNTAIDRAVKDLGTFNEWNSTAIERRQEMLAQLAKKVWDV